jgi:hypothetical protein
VAAALRAVGNERHENGQEILDVLGPPNGLYCTVGPNPSQERAKQWSVTGWPIETPLNFPACSLSANRGMAESVAAECRERISAAQQRSLEEGM